MRRCRQKIVCSNKNAGSTLFILAVGFFVTAALLVLVLPILERIFAQSYSLGFADGYDLIANNLVHGNGYRWNANMGETMMREPGFPLFLAAIFKVAGYHIEAVRLANWSLTIGIAFMVVRLAQMVTGDGRAALIASLLFLFHPGTLVAEARAGVEVLFIFVVFVFMLALYDAVAKGDPWRYFVAGLALGVVVQVRSTPVVFPVLLLFYLGLMGKDATERLRAVSNVAILVVGMAIVMTPWVIRNYMLVHEFVPVSTLGGVALQEGQCTCQNLLYGGDFSVAGTAAGHERGELASKLGFRYEGAQYFQVFYEAHDEWAFNKELFQRAKDEYVEHPGLLATCVGKNLFNFWFLGKTWKATELNMVIQIPFLMLALIGLHLFWKRGQLRKLGIILTFILSILAVHLPFVAEARYSIPVFALLSIPSSVSIISICHKNGTDAQWGTK